MIPKLWYCPMCGYMYTDKRIPSGKAIDCPACGETLIPCWECIRTGVFTKVLCQKCENKDECGF